MQTLVVYDSKFGNTSRIAHAMAEAVKPRSGVQLVALEELLPGELGTVDLLIIGCPTQSHGLSPRIRKFTNGLSGRAANGMVAATFDTRYRMPTGRTGSAARTLARRLYRNGIRLLTHESFFVAHGQPPELEPGEITRAADWAKKQAICCVVSQWCAA
jgi:flavorubredoxin